MSPGRPALLALEDFEGQFYMGSPKDLLGARMDPSWPGF